MTGKALERHQGVPAELEKVGVQLVEENGYRTVTFPPAVRENFNVLLPAQEVAQAVALIQPSIRAVQLNPDHANGPHFYNQGTQAKPRLAPTKTALETLAFTAGITVARTRPLQIAELAPYGEGAIGFEAIVRIRRPDGTPLEVSRSKVWQPDVEWRKVQAGHRPNWIDTEDKWKAELAKRWLAEREFGPAKTESKAVLRAIRAALQIPHTFTPENAAKPFIVVGYDLALDYTDPEVVRLLLERHEPRVAEVYGGPEESPPVSGELGGGEAAQPAESTTRPSDSAAEGDEATATEGSPGSAPSPSFKGEEPPEPEADPEPVAVDPTKVVLGEDYSRFAGQTIADVAATGDRAYLEWIAKPENEHAPGLAEAARVALKVLDS